MSLFLITNIFCKYTKYENIIITCFYFFSFFLLTQIINTELYANSNRKIIVMHMNEKNVSSISFSDEMQKISLKLKLLDNRLEQNNSYIAWNDTLSNNIGVLWMRNNEKISLTYTSEIQCFNTASNYKEFISCQPFITFKSGNNSSKYNCNLIAYLNTNILWVLLQNPKLNIEFEQPLNIKIYIVNNKDIEPAYLTIYMSDIIDKHKDFLINKDKVSQNRFSSKEFNHNANYEKLLSIVNNIDTKLNAIHPPTNIMIESPIRQEGNNELLTGLIITLLLSLLTLFATLYFKSVSGDIKKYYKNLFVSIKKNKKDTMKSITLNRKQSQNEFNKINTTTKDINDNVNKVLNKIKDRKFNSNSDEFSQIVKTAMNEISQSANEYDKIQNELYFINNEMWLNISHNISQLYEIMVNVNIQNVKLLENINNKINILSESDKKLNLQYAQKPLDSDKIHIVRSKPKDLEKLEIEAMLKSHNFFESEMNDSGYFENILVDNKDGTITDLKTGLMWQKSGTEGLIKPGEINSYIKNFNKTNSGYDDWRLPTIEELSTLIEVKKNNALCISQLFDSTQFKCYSSDKMKKDRKLRLYVDFKEARIRYTMDDNYLRVVRSVKKD